jgi:hypothetical protein
MADFVVRIDMAKLNAKQAEAIAAAIQGVVLSELGRLDLAHAEPVTEPGAAIIFHKEWLGLWLRSLKDLQNPKQQVLTVQAR